MPMATDQDRIHLDRALELACRGRGVVSPNPLVGAVVVRAGVVIGEGFHARFGASHAEVEALEACTDDPRGATMYVSLEPCCHEGSTPPCTDAIVAAGISRVVIASEDPSSHASGRGPGVLRDEGIEVDYADGDIATRARLMNQPFRKLARTGRPHVVQKIAMSLDGHVATHTGHSKWISGAESRERSHRWRADADAVAIGQGTATADDPLLTARVDGVERQPSRVVFDSEAALPLDSKLVASTDESPVIVVASRAAARRRIAALEAAGVEVVIAAGENEAARVVCALRELGDRGIASLLLEGGPHLAGAFFDAGEIDEMRVFVAPLVIAGRRARTAIEGEGVYRVDEALRAFSVEYERIGDDLLITARLKEW